ncbi:MAG TPA: EAL domain-containing protein, partial [Sedimenticola sp.]|nr:EAL domain-containing protein [Sedimenticola sp.]
YFLRTKTPERFGDLDQDPIIRRAITGRASAFGVKFEGGSPSLQIVRPWFDDGGGVAGFIEVGIDLDEVLYHIATVYDISVSIFTHSPGAPLKRPLASHVITSINGAGTMSLLHKRLEELIESSQEHYRQHSIRYAQGSREFAAGLFPLLDQGGRYIGFIGFNRDITQEQMAGQKMLRQFLTLFTVTGLLLFLLFTRYIGRIERRLDHSYLALRQEVGRRRKVEASQRMLSRAVEQSASAVLITDREGRIEYINSRFVQITGYQKGEVLGHTPALLRSDETNDATYRDLWSTILAGQPWVGEMHNRKKSGDLYWSRLSIAPIIGDNGEITNFVATSEDITHLMQANEEMEQLAFFDTLTGLPNRRLFRDRLEQAIASLGRLDSGISLLFLDLDQFKRINDTLGHDAGDQLLKLVSLRLKQVLRQNDTIARLGGDEFTILLEKIDGAHQATRVAGKILEVMRAPFLLDGREVPVTTSIGITLGPQDGRDAGVLMKNADLAMYQAKESGRNNFQFFSQCMNEEIAKRVLLERELLDAMEQGQFDLFYQPLVRMEDRRVIGIEALLRWRHPERGIVLPNDFLPIAEESSLINEIGRWVLWRACRDLKTLDQKLGYRLSVSINLSARQFQDPELTTQMQEALDQYGLEGDRLHLEITESMLLEKSLNPVDMLNRLKTLGVSLSIDDFGTGYSSLSYLKHFPVDQLKVDRSFVREIPQDSDDMEITAAIIVLAHKLHLQVVAEGVETEEQLLFLQQNQCDLLQGYLFSRPLPFDELTGKLLEMAREPMVPAISLAL